MRAFPIAALLLSGALLGLVIALVYDPAPNLSQVALAPWLCLQLAAVPVVASVYSIAEGWLAVPGNTRIIRSAIKPYGNLGRRTAGIASLSGSEDGQRAARPSYRRIPKECKHFHLVKLAVVDQRRGHQLVLLRREVKSAARLRH